MGGSVVPTVVVNDLGIPDDAGQPYYYIILIIYNFDF